MARCGREVASRKTPSPSTRPLQISRHSRGRGRFSGRNVHLESTKNPVIPADAGIQNQQSTPFLAIPATTTVPFAERKGTRASEAPLAGDARGRREVALRKTPSPSTSARIAPAPREKRPTSKGRPSPSRSIRGREPAKRRSQGMPGADGGRLPLSFPAISYESGTSP